MISKRLTPDIRADALLAVAFGVVSSGVPFALAQRLGARTDCVAGPGKFQAFGCIVAAVFAVAIARRPRFELVYDFGERTLEVRSLGLFARSVMVSRIEPHARVVRECDGDRVTLLSVDDDVEQRVTPPMPIEYFDSLAYFKGQINETSIDEPPAARETNAPATSLERALTAAKLWWGVSAALIVCAIAHAVSELRF